MPKRKFPMTPRPSELSEVKMSCLRAHKKKGRGVNRYMNIGINGKGLWPTTLRGVWCCGVEEVAGGDRKKVFFSKKEEAYWHARMCITPPSATRKAHTNRDCEFSEPIVLTGQGGVVRGEREGCRRPHGARSTHYACVGRGGWKDGGGGCLSCRPSQTERRCHGRWWWWGGAEWGYPSKDLLPFRLKVRQKGKRQRAKARSSCLRQRSPLLAWEILLRRDCSHLLTPPGWSNAGCFFFFSPLFFFPFCPSCPPLPPAACKRRKKDTSHFTSRCPTTPESTTLPSPPTPPG